MPFLVFSTIMLDEVTYAQAGIVDFKDEELVTLQMIEEHKIPLLIRERPESISKFGLYAIAQLGNSINIGSDIQMFLGCRQVEGSTF